MSRTALFLQLLGLVLCGCESVQPVADGQVATQRPATQDAGDQSAPSPQDPVGEFEPVILSDTSSDWIKLNSGEWLRGEFIVLRDGTVEFDSKELNELTLDWDDIHTVRLPSVRTVVLNNGDVLQGTVLVLGDGLVLNGDAERRVERRRVLSIVGVLDGESAWSGKISLGLAQSAGNTDQTDVNSYLFVRRETAATRWDTTYNSTYSRTGAFETSNNHRLRSRLDWFISRRLYLTPVGFDVFRDTFQNIAMRSTPYAAVGYDLIDGASLDWTVSIGPAYQYTSYDTVAPGEASYEATAATVLQSRFEWDITSDVDFDFDYDITVPVPSSKQFNHHVVLMLSIELISDFDIDISFFWDRVNQPTADSNGVIPAKDDFRTTVGIGYKW